MKHPHTASPAPRKTRSDKGLVMATHRDLQVLKWIAHQYAAQFFQIQQLLTRFPGAQLQGDLISEAVTQDQIRRWQRAGWAEYQRFLAIGRGWCWVTRKGLHLLDLEEDYHAAPPAAVRLQHLYAVNQLRLQIGPQYPWTSERAIRAALDLKRGERTGPIPDAYITHDKAGRIAIEAEISQKKPAELENKLYHLLDYRDPAIESTYIPVYNAVWFYVPNERIQKAAEAARAQLPASFQQRVHIVLHTNLLLE